MNRNQRHLREIARKENGLTYRCNPAYDRSCDNGKPGNLTFLGRVIPRGEQPRKSKRAKVAGHNRQ